MKIDCDLASIQRFHDAATVIEPVGRFLSLYTLLLHKYDDSQRSVDNAIIDFDPTVAQFKRPESSNDKTKKDIYETVFSKLRNEMSHKREGVNLLETQHKIKLNVDRLENIAKFLISRK